MSRTIAEDAQALEEAIDVLIAAEALERQLRDVGPPSRLLGVILLQMDLHRAIEAIEEPYGPCEVK